MLCGAKKNKTMDKKRLTARVDEALADDLAEFCRRGRMVQEGVIEAAIYWLVHRMAKDEYIEVMEQASAYLDGEATADAASAKAEFEPKTELGRKAADKLAARRRRKGAAG